MNQREEDLVKAIVDICEQLNWSIAIPTNEDGSDDIHGLIIGTQEYIDDIVRGADEFSEMDEDWQDELDASDINLKKSKKSFH